ncbi:unnamed protein product [Sphenostylis stenocarpa]|uniref:Complex 1 LYR protein domain-containing protein n=1 Tax=Sphenostylis stenocarpa TaxID=92480 RepID=A0AA86RN95_9FABA|nr:unnamed protein product [Sphenostylis stenocarpa]
MNGGRRCNAMQVMMESSKEEHSDLTICFGLSGQLVVNAENDLPMSAASASPSAAQILSLFRSLLRVSRDFPDYNIREYTKRRTIDAFRHKAALSDASLISSAYSHGMSQLAVVKRQAVVYSLYAPSLRSVMELQQAPSNSGNL